MSVATTAIDIVIDASLGTWLGAMGFFSFVGAPRAFAVFEEGAGAYVNDVFPRYYLLGVGLGTVALLATVVRGTLAGLGVAGTTLLVLLGVAVVLVAYARWWLVPQMERAGEDAFDTYHRVSVVLNGATMLAVAMALVIAHL